VSRVTGAQTAAQATANQSRRTDDIVAATPTSSPATATPNPTSTPQPKFKLDIVQWVQTRAGDPVAVVRDNRGVLWFVWGPDVPRIEQGLAPKVQPQPVNRVARTRRS
jgi:hypothetical protein